MASAPERSPVPVADLKEKFKARSIPLEQDFHDLIDMADAGRLAAGLSPEQEGTKGTAKTGLIIDTDKRLAVNAKVNGGLDVDTSGVGVVADAAKSIAVGTTGVGVVADTAKGITVSSSGVGVVADASKGIAVDAEGLSVKVNKAKGIAVDGDGVQVVVAGGKGLLVTADGLAVDELVYVKAMAMMFEGANLYARSDTHWLFVKTRPREAKLYWITKRGSVDEVLGDEMHIKGTNGVIEIPKGKFTDLGFCRTLVWEDPVAVISDGALVEWEIMIDGAPGVGPHKRPQEVTLAEVPW